MARGISLHLGLNAIDPTHYAGWDGALNACESDAESMKEIAEACGYQARIALTTEAKRDTVISFLSKDAQQLQSGDIFLLTYSGHGGRLPDINGDEPDGQDETWCLYDGQLIDDEIYQLYRGLPAGVRGFVLSDSCHSGTMLKSMFYMAALASGWVGDPAAPSNSPPKYKFMPPPIASRTYKNNRAFYDDLQRTGAASSSEASEILATVRLISGCQDNQYSLDGTFNSAFTEKLLRVWNRGKFDGDYGAFHRSVQKELPPSQSPNHTVIGKEMLEFDRQRPFKI